MCLSWNTEFTFSPKHILSAHLRHDSAAPAAHRSTHREKENAVPLFLPTVCGEEKGSAEIKEGRVTSHVEHQRETVKSGDKPFLVETELLQLTRPCTAVTVTHTMEDWEKQTWRTPATLVQLETKRVTAASITVLKTQNGIQNQSWLF